MAPGQFPAAPSNERQPWDSLLHLPDFSLGRKAPRLCQAKERQSLDYATLVFYRIGALQNRQQQWELDPKGDICTPENLLFSAMNDNGEGGDSLLQALDEGIQLCIANAITVLLGHQTPASAWAFPIFCVFFFSSLWP